MADLTYDDKYMCAECSGTTFFFQIVEPHVGVYCQTCGRWRFWISKDKAKHL